MNEVHLCENNTVCTVFWDKITPDRKSKEVCWEKSKILLLGMNEYICVF